ncbi:MAG: hypothetical protein WA110_00050 [Anaerolineaceae bacterium]
MIKNDPSCFLVEGLDAGQQEDLGDLKAVTNQLAAWQVPDPTAEEQSALVKSLVLQMPKDGASQTNPHFNIKGWVHLIFAQARLFEVEFWYACGAMLLITLVGGALVGKAALSLFTLIVSPLLAMAGVAYVFNHNSSSLSALEAASPVGPYALFFCRSALILGTNLAALPLLLIPGQLLFPQMAFWRVVVIWLGALVGVFGLATYTTVRWNGVMGTVIPLGIWGLLVGASWQRAVLAAGRWLVVPEWIMNAVSTSDGLVVGALLALIVGGWLLFQAGRWVKQSSNSWA